MLGYPLHAGESLAVHHRHYGHHEAQDAIPEEVAKAARKFASWKAGATAFAETDASDFFEGKKRL